jgi:DNA polymerase-3 subunit delta
MSAEAILLEWKKKQFKPVYWLEGEEEYFIDKLMAEAENNLLTEEERSFNLTIFYGRDANWPDVINACKRYPMFAERQVVLIKEAQLMKDIDKLEPYFENPLSSTILVVSYKDKKLDSRKKFAKLIKEKGVVFTTKKLYEREIVSWIEGLVKSKGLTVSPKGLVLLSEHIGNDLARIENEVDKMLVNLGDRKTINEDDIEKYVGVSKEFNAFELQAAIAQKDLPKAIRIIQYFEANPKVAPIQVILPSIYTFFSKVFMIYGAGTSDERSIAATIGVPPFFVKDYISAARRFSYPEVEKVMLLLNQYNLKSIGVGAVNTEDASLLKELVMKIIL